MGNNGNKLRRKKVLVCLVGGHKHAIIMTIIAIGNKNTVLRKENQMKTK